jgi:hypothetical protein
MNPTRRAACARLLALVAAPLAAASLLSSCAGLAGPREVNLPLERLQRNLDKRFPINQRAAGVFDIQFSAPQVTTLRENDRIALSADVIVTPMLMRQSWRGNLAISGRLVVDTVRNAVFLSDAQVERFAIEGMGESQQRQITGVANILVDKLIRDMPIYSFNPDDLRYAGVQFAPTTIRTTPTGLVVMLEPVK